MLSVGLATANRNLMSIRNNHWYNLNEQRNYPIDATASCISDDGARLPNDVIQDLRISWPKSYGMYAFISGLSATEHIVTVLISVSSTADNSPDDSSLIAGVTVPRNSLVPGQTLALTTFKDYVGGFITLGNINTKIYTGKFGSPSQTLLTARAARPYRSPPIPTIRVNGSAAGLSGLVNLTAVAPLKLTKETKTIDNVEYDNVIVFSLFQETSNITTQEEEVSVFQTFAGDCGKRIGARNCPDPQPVETINGVSPDCDGVLKLTFDGCAVVGRNTQDCGVIIDCSLGLTESCEPPYLPTLDEGLLPSEVPSLLNPIPAVPEEVIPPTISISETIVTILSLPYCDTFDDGFAYNFSPLGDSVFSVIGDDSPNENNCCLGADQQYACSESVSDSVSYSYSESGSQQTGWRVEKQYINNVGSIASSYGAFTSSADYRRNISLFTGDVQTLFRKYSVDLKVIDGPEGTLKNAGIVINYRLLESGDPVYLLALVDITRAVFGLYYFNGTQTITITETNILALKSNEWYNMTVKTLVSENKAQVNFVLTLEGIDNTSINSTINTSISSSLWVTDSGNSGLYSYRSRSYFSYWRIDEALE